MSRPISRTRRAPGCPEGFSLIELIVVVAILGILATAAMPAYKQYIVRSNAKTASADLLTLGLQLDNVYQLKQQFPIASTATTAATQALVQDTASAPVWTPAQKGNFTFTASSSLSGYQLTATGLAAGAMNGCVLSLDSRGNRGATSPCGFTSW